MYFVQADSLGPYCVQSVTGAWLPGYLFQAGDAFTITLNEQGSYTYRDAFSGKTGLVQVGSLTNEPPLLTISSPPEGSCFIEPATVVFTASAYDRENGIWAIELSTNSVLVTAAYTAPFTTTLVDLGAGEYVLTAKAYDTLMASTTRSVTITVDAAPPPPIRMSIPVVVGSELHFVASGLTVGRTLVTEACTERDQFTTWTPVETNFITSETLFLARPMSPESTFFRLLQAE